MRNIVFGLIGMIWGGAILVGKLLGGGSTEGSSSYEAGGVAALVFAVLLLIAGAYYLRKGLQERASTS